MRYTVLMLLATFTAFTANAVPITATSSSDFTIKYDGIGGNPVSVVNGLSAEVRFHNFSFSDDGSNTTVIFDFDIFNTSSNPVETSRVSTLGFDTTPDIESGSSVSGVFDTVTYSGNVPNQGRLEFCFSDVNCAGGGSGGVTIGQVLGNEGTAMLLYDGVLSAVTFDKFTVRYQSVSCITGYTGNCPGSASGSGSSIPEPGTFALLSLGLVGVSAFRLRNKKAVSKNAE